MVTTDRGTVIAARSMLLTVGIGSFSPKPLPAAADWTGGGVIHFVPQPAVLAGQDVVIVGGGDSAVDWAHMLYPVAKSVRVCIAATGSGPPRDARPGQVDGDPVPRSRSGDAPDRDGKLAA